MEAQVQERVKKTRTIAQGTVRDLLNKLGFTPNPMINENGEASVTGKDGAEWYALASAKQTGTIETENGERRGVQLCVRPGFDMANRATYETTAEEVLEARTVTHNDGSTGIYRHVVIYVGGSNTVQTADSLF